MQQDAPSSPDTNTRRPASAIARAVRGHLLPRLPWRISRFAHATLRRRTLQVLRRRPDKRRVLIVTHDLSRSGAPFLILVIANILRRLGRRAIVLSPVDGPFIADLLGAGHDVIVDPDLARAVWLPGLAASADMAICNTIETAGAVDRLSPMLPTLWYLHEVSLLERRMADPSVARALAAAATVWAGSPMCQALLLPRRSDVAVVPYGVAPLADAVPVAIGDRPIEIGVFGSIESRKGQDLVVDAVASLPDDVRRQLRVTLYGRTLEPGFAATLQARIEPGDPISFAGELDRAAYVAAMRASDAVLVSSRDDTLPIVSIDALGLGKMLLLVPSVGTSAWLTDGSDCLIAAETSGAGIADLLVRALAARPDAARIGGNAQNTFATCFSRQAFRAKVIEALDE